MDNPERVRTEAVRQMFDHDLQYMKTALQGWQTKREQALSALHTIDDFLSQNPVAKEISFQEHAHLCFCLAALIDGVPLSDLDAEYDKQLYTMVKGVVHPHDKWTVQTELENQEYAKYIFHVSLDGLATIELLNYMTSFRVDTKSQFCGVRIVL